MIAEISRVKVILTICLAVQAAGFVAAQSDPNVYDPRKNKITLYYNNTWQLTKPQNAVYKRECFIDLINMEFYGVFKDFTIAGKLIRDGYYERGVKKGLHTEYDENGAAKSTIEYADDDFIIWELKTDKEENGLTRGTGKFVIPYYNFEEVDETRKLHEGIISGEFLNGKRVGKWIYSNLDNRITDEETYDGGKFAQRKAYTKSGPIDVHEKKPIFVSIISLVVDEFIFDTSAYTNLSQYFEQNVVYPESLDRRVTFPAGMKRFLLLLAVHQEFSTGEMMAARVTVDEHGQVKKIKGPFVVGANYDDEFQRLIKPYQSMLLPALSKGKPYDSTIKIPILNSPAWINYLQTAPEEDVNAYVEELNQD